MALTSASTDAQVWAAYEDNCGYAESSSPTMAADFVQAAMMLLRRLPKQMGQQGGSVANNPEMIQAEIQTARQWLAVNGTRGVRPGGVGYFSLTNSRQ